MIRMLQAAALALVLELSLLAVAPPALAYPLVDASPSPNAPGARPEAAASEAPSTPPKTAPPPAASAARRAAPPLPPEYIPGEEGSWIRLAYHPSMRDRARGLVTEAQEVRKKLREELGADVLTSVEVRVAAAVAGEIDRLAPPAPKGDEGAATFPELRLIVLAPPSPLANDPEKLSNNLRHQLALLALDEAVAAPSSSPGARARGPLPGWIREGYATYFARDNAALRAQTLTFAALRGRLLSLADLPADAPASTPQASIAYAEAADFMRFLAQPSSRVRFTALIAAARGGAPFEQAVASAYDQSFSEIELAWRRDVARRYGFMPVLLASTVVWVAVGAALSARRARRARAAGERRPFLVREARRAMAVDPEARVRLVRSNDRRAAATIRARAIQSEIKELGGAIPPEAEIPKVEHEGQWHTLH